MNGKREQKTVTIKYKYKYENLLQLEPTNLCNCVNKSILLRQTGELYGLNCSSGATEICASERRRVSQEDIELGRQKKANIIKYLM